MIGYGEPSPMVEKSEVCKPDPKAMLQKVRKRIQQHEEAKELLVKLYELPVSIHFGDRSEHNFAAALGGIEIRLLELRKEIQYWLDEINKG